jgi:hypothetical protein
VVNVRDDGDVPNVLHNLKSSRIGCHPGEKGQAARRNKITSVQQSSEGSFSRN